MHTRLNMDRAHDDISR